MVEHPNMKQILFAILAAALPACWASNSRGSAFVFGGKQFVQSLDGDSQRVAYQAQPISVVESVVSSSVGGGPLSDTAKVFFRNEAQPQAMIVFFSRDQQVGSFNADKFAALQNALAAAEGSVSLPYLQQEGENSLKARLLDTAAAASAAGSVIVQHIGSCDARSVAPLDHEQLPQINAAKRTLLLVCPSASDSHEEFMRVLESLTKAVARLNIPHLFVFVADPAGSAHTGASRTLLAKEDAVGAPAPPPEVRVCDDKCRTQVSQLEAGILLFTLIVALGFGTWCMGILDAPTKFENAKDER